MTDTPNPEAGFSACTDLLGMMLPLVWTAPAKPNSQCRYDHVIAETPFGRFLITWKSWKAWDSPTIDETPWGDFFGVGANLEAAQGMAECEYQNRLLACFLPNAEVSRPAAADGGQP